MDLTTKMEEFLRVEDYDGLATFCEQAELEASRVMRCIVQCVCGVIAKSCCIRLLVVVKSRRKYVLSHK